MFHTFFLKDIDIDNDNTFTAEVSKKNELENVIFRCDYEYAVTGMTLNSTISDSELLKIDNFKELDKMGKEIK